jgi:hypothetical protein
VKTSLRINVAAGLLRFRSRADVLRCAFVMAAFVAHLACGRADAANRYWTGDGTWNLTNTNWGTAGTFVTVTAVPEPSAVALGAAGIVLGRKPVVKGTRLAVQKNR